MNISGNTIFIPGASSGIGLALALRLQAAGNTVVIGGRRSDVLDGHADLNVLIAMAGVMATEDVREASFLEEAERIIDTNIAGPLRLVSAFIEQLQSQPDSTLITVSSGLAFTPLASTPTYNGSKAFIHQFSETIRLQLVGTSVKVVELVPPAVQTELTPGQSTRENYLPLDDFADEVLALLESQPDAQEILVERVKFLRFAEVEGRYGAAVAAINPLPEQQPA